MPNEITCTAFQCIHTNSGVSVQGVCSSENPFQHSSEDVCIEHEKNHLSLIGNRNRQKYICSYAQKIFTDSLVVGSWNDWSLLYGLGKKLSLLMRHPKLMGSYRSLSYKTDEMLYTPMKDFLWQQTECGRFTKGDKGCWCRNNPFGQSAEVINAINADWAQIEPDVITGDRLDFPELLAAIRVKLNQVDDTFSISSSGWPHNETLIKLQKSIDLLTEDI
jgi:hypothetical protein